MDKFKLFFLLSAFLLLCSRGFPQNNTSTKPDSILLYSMGEIVVTATKTLSNSIELANSISVIDSTEISNRNKINVFELIKNEYGLSSVQQGGVGSLSNVSIRGGNFSHTLVLLDGVEVNLPSDPSNVYDFAALPTDNIERIEILRGPQSVLYGSDAMAGVINIITKNGKEKPKFSLSAEGGSYNTYKLLAGSSGSVSDLNYTVSLSRTKTEGFSAASEKLGNSEKDGFELSNISSVIGYRIDENTTINFTGRFSKSRADYDQFGGLAGDDPTYTFDQEEFLLRGEGKLNYFNSFWEQKVGFSFFRNVRKYSFDETDLNPSFSRSLYDGRKYKFELLNNLKFSDQNIFVIGLEAELEETISEYYLNASFGSISSFFPKNNTKSVGAFLQSQLKIGESFFSTIGIRIDNHNKFGTEITYRVAPAYIIRETGTKLKATIGSGFKAPSLFYLYDPAYGNPGLDPERSIGWDAGIEQFFFKEGLTMGITYFHNNFKDMFGFDSLFKAININKAVTNGAEVFARLSLNNDLEVKTSYTFTNAIDKSENSPNFEKKLLRRPEHKAGLLISYFLTQAANLTGEFNWVGKRDDLDFSVFERIELDDYFIINLAASYNITSLIRLNFRIENLLDTDYAEVFGYSTPGISVYGGIKFLFD
jgi:vitamin B12 transporter